MKLIEERQSVKLQIVALIMLLTSTILVQVADYRINSFDVYYVQKALALLSTHQVREDFSMKADFYTLFQYLPGIQPDVETILDKDKSQYVFPEERELAEQLNNGSLSAKEFFSKLSLMHRSRSRQLMNEYYQGATQLNEYIQKGTVWLPIRNFVLVPMQFIFIGILIIGYSQLLMQISKRANKSRHKQRHAHNKSL